LGVREWSGASYRKDRQLTFFAENATISTMKIHTKHEVSTISRDVGGRERVAT
jgi:hypothetical protein